MALFLAVLEGQTPSEARTLLATGDMRLIGVVVEELAKRLSPDSVLLPRVVAMTRARPVAEPQPKPETI